MLSSRSTRKDMVWAAALMLLATAMWLAISAPASAEPRTPREGWASIAASAFGSDYSDDLVIKSFTSAYNVTTGNLEASIQLPQGATILEFKVWFYDTDAGDATAYLYRLEPGVSAVQMAEVTSAGITGEGAASDTTIYHGDDPVTEPVDNSVYTYGISVDGANQVNRMIRQAMVRYRLGPTG